MNNENNKIIGYDSQTGQPISINQNNNSVKKKKFKWWIPVLFFVSGFLMLLGNFVTTIIVKSQKNLVLETNLLKNPIIISFRWLAIICWLMVIPSLIITIIKYNKKTSKEKIQGNFQINNIINNVNSLDEKLLIAYIGNNYEKLIQKKFSVPALFLSWIYALYRKVYIPSIIGMLAIIILGFLPSIIYTLLILVFVIALGIYFNKLYIIYAKKQIEKIKIKNPNSNENELVNICSKKGGTNIGIAIIIYIVFVIISTVLNLNISNLYNKSNNKDVKLKFTKEEFTAIINAYGDAATLTLNNVLKLNIGEIPTFDEIKDYIIFDQYNVECNVSRVNYDGTIYLAGCLIDGYDIDENITYGKYLLNPEKTGDKIYVYSSSYTHNKATTGEVQEQTLYSFLGEKSDKTSSNSKYLGMYECYDLKCKAYDVNPKTNELLVYDGKYYLYNLNTNTKKVFEEFNSISNEIYTLVSYISTGKKVYGLSVKGEKGTAFYSFDNSEFLTDFTYNNFYLLDSLIEKGYIIGYKNYNSYLININNKEIYKTLIERVNIEEEKIGNTVVYYAQSSNPKEVSQFPTKFIYNENLEEILTSDNAFYLPVLNNNNTISVKNENGFKLYNYDGSLNYTSKQYKEIICIVRDYVVVLDSDNNLKVLDLQENELATLLKVTDNYRLHSMISGYFAENGKNGIYVVVGDDNIPYGTEGSGLEYYYIPITGEIGVIKTNGVGGYAKPVLYLYPQRKTKITVNFDKEYLLTTTYPKFENNWSVTAFPNGDLYDKNGNYYYALYWEEDGSNYVDFSKGFYVSKDNAIEFLEEKLSIIGLNEKEKNEFIMYWLPILENNQHNLVYFELTNERQNYNKLLIKPKPDSLLRVAIHVKKVDGYRYIEEQKLSTFNRKGFVAVEWGGVIH